MCGIAGFADFTGTSTKEVLSQMAGSVAHRGPDGQGAYLHAAAEAVIGLGHRRLSIIDLSTSANQPMHWDGLHIVFNGEIYNYNEIRNTLLAKGHQFVTHGDTEVILHAWREWGEAAVQQWHGMFAIVLYDEKSNEVIGIRDRAGVKPLFYYQHSSLFLFASELKSFLVHPGFRKKVSTAAVAAFLQYGHVPTPHCIYEHACKLKPGHLFRLGLQTQALTVKPYWNVYDYYNKPKLKLDFAEAKKQTEQILQKAFNYRMVADVPVGVFLSGGFDSACVTALLQKDKTEKIKTFTIGSTDNALDEAPFAREVARHLGTDHTEYYCTSGEALNIIPELPYFYDEPFADSSAIPTILVSRLAREKVTVALSADAGDEIFAGYNRYDYLMRYGSVLNNIPKPFRKAAAGIMDTVSSEKIPYFNQQANFHSRYHKIKNLLHDPSPAEMLRNLSQVFTNTQLQSLFIEKLPQLQTAYASHELAPEFYDPLSYMMAIDYQTYLLDDILQKVDRATMSVSLEGREPFLDQSVIEWAATLPNNYKYNKGTKKYILKQIVYEYIPSTLMDRKKMGFGIPVAKWLQKELKPLVQEYLSVASLSKHKLFCVASVQKVVSDFFSGRTELYLKIWHLLMFQMWYQQWIG